MSQRLPPCFLAAVVLGFTGLTCAPEPQGPNVVLIVIDTLRADAILDPEGRVDTPNIDALAADGAQFPLAFAHVPFTLPSHAALLSARYGFQSGIVRNGQHVSDELPLFPQWVREHGYAARAAVSIGTLATFKDVAVFHWAFDEYRSAQPFVRRAGESQSDQLAILRELERREPFFFFAHYADPHAPYNAHGRADARADVRLGGQLLVNVATSSSTYHSELVEIVPGGALLEIHSTARMYLHHLSMLEAGQPIPLIELGGNETKRGKHFRYRIPNPTDAARRCQLRLWISDHWDAAEARVRYRLEVEYVDRFVGELLGQLKAKGLYEDALIVLTSDHGEGLGQRGDIGHGGSLYDEQIHVPLIMKLPSDHPRRGPLARRTNLLVRHVDVVPTLLELMRLPALPGQVGVSLLEDAERVLFAETRPASGKDALCLRNEHQKLVYSPAHDRFALYDLLRDPGEVQNVYGRGHEPPQGWEDLLRTRAKLVGGAPQPEDFERAMRENLEALGY